MKLNQKQLAQALDVAPATLSQATSNNHRCKGHPVASWAVRDAGGRVRHYQVPGSVQSDLAASQSLSQRQNPPNEGANKANKPQKQQKPSLLENVDLGSREDQPAVYRQDNRSVFPQGQDYRWPAAFASSAAAVRAMVENPNAISKTALCGIGALGGAALGDTADQPILGAVAGIGATALLLRLFTQENQTAVNSPSVRGQLRSNQPNKGNEAVEQLAGTGRKRLRSSRAGGNVRRGSGYASDRQYGQGVVVTS